MNQHKEIEGACHCRTVRFRVKLLDGLAAARRCTCSYCRMRGAVVVSANAGDISFQSGEEALTLYRFNTGVAGTISVPNAVSTRITGAAQIHSNIV